MTKFAYFIGGPADLTKLAIPDADRRDISIAVFARGPMLSPYAVGAQKPAETTSVKYERFSRAEVDGSEVIMFRYVLEEPNGKR